MRMIFGTLKYKVARLIATNVTLDDLKSYLQWCFIEIRPQLADARSIDEVLFIFEQKYTITNVYCLEEIVDHFNIAEARDHITGYKKALSEFCNLKLSQCLNKNLGSDSSPQLTGETIEFVLDWEPDKYTLHDITSLLWKTFKEMANDIHVRVMTEGNSITITCYAPQHIMDSLLMEAEKNLDILRGSGLMKLTIGYYTLWDIHTKDKVKIK